MRTSCALVLATASLLAVPVWAQKPIGEVFAADASIRGSVVLAGGGMRVMSGSSVAAGESTASMRLSRGGEVRICPRTSVSVATAPNGRDLMLGMGTGAVETHYTVGNNADSILTPDFRILLAGPGTFHLAIAADARGNTCVRTLNGNTASIIVTEQLGDGVYQVRPHDQVMFRNGGVSTADSAVPPDCGCPAPVNLPVQQAQAAPPPAPLPQAATPAPPPQLAPPAKPAQEQPFEAPAPAASSIASAGPAPSPVRSEAPRVPAILLAPTPVRPPAAKGADVTAPPPPLPAGELHVQVEAPFVFRAAEPRVPAAPVIARVRLQPLPALLLAGPTVTPPPASQVQVAIAGERPAKSSPKKKGFFGRIGSFFATVFH